MTCDKCPHTKPLAFAVYCKADPELRDLPNSVGMIMYPLNVIITTVAPSWCPLKEEEADRG